MQYRHVCIESIAYALPSEIVTSGEVENALQPAYSRLRYEPGRFERVYGITERRFWPRGTLPGEISITTAERAIHEAGVRCEQIGAVVHTSVCRDGLQTATASRVHLELGLPAACICYDVMNACLGFLNGMIQVANMIELGQIQAGVVVGTESSRALVETTIAQLNADVTLTRKSFKASLPSLSIGSGSVAAVLASDEISQTGNRLVGGKALADTSGFELCVGSEDQAADENMAPLMTTDSHKLLSKGLALGRRTVDQFLSQTCWTRDMLARCFSHQVSVLFSQVMLQGLGLDPSIDFRTVDHLGNTGSVALPLTMAIAAESGQLQDGDKIALLGVGSGINTIAMGVDWRSTPCTSCMSRKNEFATGPPC